MKEKTLKCKDISKQINEFIISNIHFELKAGYILGIVGKNGTGKTTLMRILCGSYLADTGDVELDGVSVKNNAVAYKQQIAFILGETPFPTNMRVKECGERFGRYYKTFDYNKYISYLQSFHVPEKKKLQFLSKGELIKQQLAFALSYDAKLYVLDEPAGNLDVEFREQFYQYIRDIVADESKMVVYASHLVDELEGMADYILWLSEEHEKQWYFGTTEQLLNDYRLVFQSKEELVKTGIANKEDIVGFLDNENHAETLLKVGSRGLPKELKKISRYASLKEIMYYTEKR